MEGQLVDETLEHSTVWKEGRLVQTLDIFADSYGDVRHTTSLFLHLLDAAFGHSAQCEVL